MCIVNILSITLWKPITIFMCNIILFVAYHVILNEYRNNLVVNFIVWSQRVVKLMSVNVVTVILHACAILYINNFYKWLHKFYRIMSVRLWCLSSIMISHNWNAKMPNIRTTNIRRKLAIRKYFDGNLILFTISMIAYQEICDSLSEQQYGHHMTDWFAKLWRKCQTLENNGILNICRFIHHFIRYRCQ